MTGQSAHILEDLESRINLNGGAVAVGGTVNLIHTTAMLSQPRYGPGATSVGTKAFFAGGLDAASERPIPGVDIFDSSTGQWSTHPIRSKNDARNAVAVGTQALFTGKGGTNDAVDIYDEKTGIWSTAALSIARASYATVAAGSKVFFAGGAAGSATPGQFVDSRVVDIYDAPTGVWATAELSEARDSLKGAAVSGKVLFAGGIVHAGLPQSTFSNVVDIYDSATIRWTTARLSQKRNVAAVAVVGNFAIFAGGLSGKSLSRSGASNVVDIYNATTGRWSRARLSNAAESVAVTTLGTRVFLGTDNPDHPDRGADVDIFDSVTGHWSKTTISQHAVGLSAVSLGTKALFGGGTIGANFKPSDFVDVYNAATSLWSRSPFTARPAVFGVTTLGTKAFFAGANDLSNPASASASAVDIYTDTAPSAVLSGGIWGSAGHNDFVTVTVTVTNAGDADLPAGYTVVVYASPNRTLTGAVPLGSVTIKSLLAAGESARINVPTTLSKGIAAGSYHLLAAVTDASGKLTPIGAEDGAFRVWLSGNGAAQRRSAGAFTRLSYAAAQFTWAG